MSSDSESGTNRGAGGFGPRAGFAARGFPSQHVVRYDVGHEARDGPHDTRCYPAWQPQGFGSGRLAALRECLTEGCGRLASLRERSAAFPGRLGDLPGSSAAIPGRPGDIPGSFAAFPG